jgi:hypothetical protein
MSAPRKNGQEFRDRAVRMYRDRLAEPGESKPWARGHVGSLLICKGRVAQLGGGALPGRRHPVRFGSGHGIRKAPSLEEAGGRA